MHVPQSTTSTLVNQALLLLSIATSLALPTTKPEVGVEATLTSRTLLHPCSVFVQRWCQDCDTRFDVAYFNAAWITPWNWPIAAWWNQESDTANVPTVGSELVPVQVGSYILQIIDTADPAVGNSSDPGKLSFIWGTQTWDSFSAGNPCDVDPVGVNAIYGGSTNVECQWMCDS